MPSDEAEYSSGGLISEKWHMNQRRDYSEPMRDKRTQTR